MKTNEYDLLPIFISLRCCPNALIGVPFAAVNRTWGTGNLEDDGEGGKRET